MSARPSHTSQPVSRTSSATGAVTYVRDYQVVLTRRNVSSCGYAAHPFGPSGPPPSIKKIKQMLRTAARLGADQITVTAGDGIDQLPDVCSTMRYYGYPSWWAYLRAVCELVAAQCPRKFMLVQLDVGPVSLTELHTMRRCIGNVLLMLPTMDERVARVALNQADPARSLKRRLASLEELGKLAVPTETGLLVGIGETAESYVRAAETVTAIQKKRNNIASFVLRPYFPDRLSEVSPLPPVQEERFVQAIRLVKQHLHPSILVSAELQGRPDLVQPAVAEGVTDLGRFFVGSSEHIDFDFSDRVELLRDTVRESRQSLVERMPLVTDAEDRLPKDIAGVYKGLKRCGHAVRLKPHVEDTETTGYTRRESAVTADVSEQRLSVGS